MEEKRKEKGIGESPRNCGTRGQQQQQQGVQMIYFGLRRALKGEKGNRKERVVCSYFLLVVLSQSKRFMQAGAEDISTICLLGADEGQ